MTRSETTPAASTIAEAKRSAVPSGPTVAATKIQASHLERLAVVYVRQSSQHQVLDHRESKERQYALADRAVELGWPADRILVIDEDQGQSAKSPDNRNGFQRLLAEITMDHTGIVLGLEMSRLARSSKDWHELFELCSVFGTLLADEDGVYDTHDPTDRAVLGLKGIMSELELHTLHNRLHRNALNKARRGELFTVVPIGYVRVPNDGVALDPDQQVQSVVRLIFEKFEELRAASAVLRYLVKYDIRIGVRRPNGRVAGPVDWTRPSNSTLLTILHNPTYAGTYCWKRRTSDVRRKGPSRRGQLMLPMDEWEIMLPNAVPAYITWDQYLANQKTLESNHARIERMGSARNGPALLPGLLRCGHCGNRMIVAYKGNAIRYTCLREAIEFANKPCQHFKGNSLEELVRDKVLLALAPASLELSITAANDIQHEHDRVDQNWQQRLERAQYETDRAKRQYDSVEPENRLVVRELEQRWESALRDRQKLMEEYDRFCRTQARQLTEKDVERIRSLASDIPAIWNAQETTAQDRKMIVRQLIEKVVAKADAEYIDISIHWTGGFVSQHEVMQPVGSFERLRDYERLKQRTLELHLAGWPYSAIAKQLVKEKYHSPTGLNHFSRENLRRFLVEHCSEELGPSQGPFRRFLEKDEWLAGDLSRELNVPSATLHFWRRRGWLHARRLPSGRWIVWANQDELDRLRRLRAAPPSNKKDQPELTTPIDKPEA